MPPLPNYMTKEQQEEPTFQRRSKGVAARSFTQEANLTAVELTECKLNLTKLTQRIFPKQLICELAGAMIDRNGDMLEYLHLMKRPEYKEIWGRGYGNEIGRLTQGMKGRVNSTDTMHFIHKHKVRRDRFKDVTYGKINCHYREGKAEPNQVQLTAGGRPNKLPRKC